MSMNKNGQHKMSHAQLERSYSADLPTNQLTEQKLLKYNMTTLIISILTQFYWFEIKVI